MTKNVDFFINIAKVYAILSKSLDSKLWWIWFNDFIVLYHLDKAIDNKLKRIELAESVWLTASGITRLLLPMEKIGLISKEANPNDARISFVLLTKNWKKIFDEAIDRINSFSCDVISNNDSCNIEDINKFICKLWWKIMWK